MHLGEPLQAEFMELEGPFHSYMWGFFKGFDSSLVLVRYGSHLKAETLESI